MPTPYDPNGPFQSNSRGGGIGGFLRLLLGRRAERPQDPSAYDPTTVSQHAMRASTTSQRTSKAMPQTAPTVTPTPRRGRTRRFGLLRFLPHAIIAIVTLVGGIASVASKHSTVSIPHIGKAFEPTCPRAAPGTDVLDSARTDCTALDPTKLLSSDRSQSIQGTEYHSVATDGTDLCAPLAATPKDRAALTANGCQAVARELFVANTSGGFGGVALIVYDTGAHARASIAGANANHSPVRMLGTPPAEQRGAFPPPRLDQVRGTLGTCIASAGRYVICTRVAPVGRNGEPVPQAVRGTMMRDMVFAALDPVIARRFASL
ncbi:MAG: hypothetical protein JWM98_80 [Thermoleophilia bacterium]|nr:hypothetical protein [Thermoleophilia bacterium]